MTTRRKAPAGPRAPREHGTGSITSYPTKGGLRWRFEISAPVDPARPGEGVRRHSRGGFASYEGADVELTLLRADLIRGVAKPVGRDTFGAYARRWVDGYAGRSGTRLYIQRAIDAMEPYVGHLRLVEIRPTDLAAAYRGLENGTKQAPSAKRPRKGLATSTVARYANWGQHDLPGRPGRGAHREEPRQLQARRPAQGPHVAAREAVLDLGRRRAHPVL